MFPSREEVKRIKDAFPVGCRVELIYMNDLYAPPEGTLGTVRLVDDIGTIHVSWDTGHRLGVALGEDDCRRID